MHLGSTPPARSARSYDQRRIVGARVRLFEVAIVVIVPTTTRSAGRHSDCFDQPIGGRSGGGSLTRPASLGGGRITSHVASE